MKYRTIVADPPWPYRSTSPGPCKGNGANSAAARYPLMSIEDISALPVSMLTDDTAHLYLWTTNAFLEEAHLVARAWLFTPKTCITWVKTKADGTPSMKTGYYYRGATEHVLFCIRGRMRLRGPARPTVLFSKRLPHSIKPDAFFGLVEEQSPGPYLELFARGQRIGWDTWGNECENHVELTSA